jgi:hypothetical protein
MGHEYARCRIHRERIQMEDGITQLYISKKNVRFVADELN